MQTSDTSAILMCAPADTDPVVGGGPAHLDTVNSLVLETLLVIRTLVENKQVQESQKGGGIQVHLESC